MAKVLYYGDPIARAHPLNRGLVLRWQVVPWYASGPRLIDLAGRNHGTLTNGPTWAGAGRPGGFGALRFVGASSQYAQDATNATALQPANVTLSVWVNSTVWGHYRDIVGNLNSGWTRGYGISNGIADANNVGFWVRGQSVFGNYSFGAKVSAATLPVNTWHLLTGTYDGTTTRFYVDGIQADSASGGSAAAGPIGYDGLANGLSIARNYVGDKTFDGSADDLRVYSRALSASEVYGLYDDSRRGSPDTLRWISPRAWFAPTAAPAGNPWLYYAQGG